MNQVSKILIVDDSDADQFLSKRMIRKFDSEIEVSQAYDGKEALEILQRSEQLPDLIFLDINMPRMDGHEFLAEFEEIYNESVTTVIIMLTSSDQERDKERSLAYQCVKNYCVKPLDGLELENYLEQSSTI